MASTGGDGCYKPIHPPIVTSNCNFFSPSSNSAKVPVAISFQISQPACGAPNSLRSLSSKKSHHMKTKSVKEWKDRKKARLFLKI